MANVTVTMDEELLERAKAFSAAQGKSLSAVIREDFQRKLDQGDSSTEAWWDDFMHMTDSRVNGNSHGWKWNRAELYER